MMRDLAFISFLGAMFAMGLRRPFLLVLTYVYIDIVAPQRLTYYLLNSVPVSLIAVVMAVGGWIVADDKSGTRVTPRQIMIGLLLVYCAITTRTADFPVQALDKWDWVWKALAFAAFLPFTLRTRLRIEALLLFMVLAVSSIIIVGGIKTLVTGGGYGSLNLMIADNSGLFEGSIISTVAVAIIPLILWFSRFGTVFVPDWKVKTFCYALVFACLLMPIGTSARTGLVCEGLVAVLMLRETKRKVLFASLMAVAAVAAVPFLPKSYTARMGTIETYKGDESASTRIAVWQWTIDYAKSHPFGGGFAAYLQDEVHYDLVKVTGSRIEHIPTTDRARAYHSSYFEMLGEQGYPGLALWLLINIAGLVRMEVVRQTYRRKPDFAWAASLATALQIAHVVYLVGAAFVGIAFQPFVYMLIGAQIGLDSYLARRRAAARWRPMRAAPPPQIATA